MELRFMKWADRSDNVLKWNSEEVVIPYISPIDNKRHRYFPDFLIQTDKGWTLIEVKPQVQTKPPKKKTRVTKSYLYELTTYAVNQAKWKAAQEYCLDRRIEFKVITEDELGIK